MLEAAIASGQAASQNLALFQKNSAGSVVYVLYDPAKFASAEGDDPRGVIYGYIDIKPHHGDAWDAGEVKFAAAEKGYGPLMYELAMSDFPGGLMPDRLSTSAAARNVWKKYEQRPDVVKKPFDDISNPKTPTKADDAKLVGYDEEEAYLNNAFVGAGDSGSKAALLTNHKDTVATLADQTQSNPVAIENTLMRMGDEFFGLRMQAS